MNNDLLIGGGVAVAAAATSVPFMIYIKMQTFTNWGPSWAFGPFLHLITILHICFFFSSHIH